MLVAMSIFLLVFMPSAFVPVSISHSLVGTVAYSLRLKREPMFDVLVLAGLFTIRVLAGAIVLPVPVSFWLLSFSMFLFLSLALVKRYSRTCRTVAIFLGAVNSQPWVHVSRAQSSACPWIRYCCRL